MAAGNDPDTLRVAAVQCENVVGDLAGNAERILDGMRWAEAEGADVVVFPELALTGYPLMDLALRNEFVDAALPPCSRSPSSPARRRRSSARSTASRRAAPGTRAIRDVAISAAVVCDGELRGMYHKTLLPNYEVFNEARNFAPGDIAGQAVADRRGGRGHRRSARTPGRATARRRRRPPPARASCSSRTRRPSTWRSRAGAWSWRRRWPSAPARPFVYVNSVGGQDELVFDGGSLIVDANGELLYRAQQFETERFCVDVPLGPPRAVTQADDRAQPPAARRGRRSRRRPRRPR